MRLRVIFSYVTCPLIKPNQPAFYYLLWVMVNIFLPFCAKKRATGIEPAWPAWKAGTLPLSYARAEFKLPLHASAAKFFFDNSAMGGQALPLAIWFDAFKLIDL